MREPPLSLEEMEARILMLKVKVQKHMKDVEQLLESTKKKENYQTNSDPKSGGLK
ncbi:MAG: hypothetical protein NZM38_09055 [Cytophagales bacterium]|nr:hypothetical protein [Cytophagales bacterium]MDW8384907.1 hypothetical protein [Flammeovirgaceae bacterium]